MVPLGLIRWFDRFVTKKKKKIRVKWNLKWCTLIGQMRRRQLNRGISHTKKSPLWNPKKNLHRNDKKQSKVSFSIGISRFGPLIHPIYNDNNLLAHLSENYVSVHSLCRICWHLTASCKNPFDCSHCKITPKKTPLSIRFHWAFFFSSSLIWMLISWKIVRCQKVWQETLRYTYERCT